MSITLYGSHSDGLGHTLVVLVGLALEAHRCGRTYTHKRQYCEHAALEGKTEEEWADICNDLITRYFIPPSYQGSSPSWDTWLVFGGEGRVLSEIIRSNSDEFTPFIQHYWNIKPAIPWPNNSAGSGPIIVLHVRVLNDTDTVRSEDERIRHAFVWPGSEGEQFFKNVHSQLRALFPSARFYLFCTQPSLVMNWPNDVVLWNPGLATTIHAMIQADILVASRSNLSAISSYYRTGPTLVFDRWDYAASAKTMFVKNLELSSGQKESLIHNVKK